MKRKAESQKKVTAPTRKKDTLLGIDVTAHVFGDGHVTITFSETVKGVSLRPKDAKRLTELIEKALEVIDEG